MKIVMDSDCLVKLTKAGAKEAILQGMEVYIPDLVKRETVDEVKGRGYQDALTIEANIDCKKLHVVMPHTQGNGLIQVPATKGEREVVSLYLAGGYDAVASDDRRFLKKLEAADIPYLTPTACIIFLYQGGVVEKSMTLAMLEGMKPFVSREEYLIGRFYLEGISHEGEGIEVTGQPAGGRKVR